MPDVSTSNSLIVLKSAHITLNQVFKLFCFSKYAIIYQNPNNIHTLCFWLHFHIINLSETLEHLSWSILYLVYCIQSCHLPVISTVISKVCVFVVSSIDLIRCMFSLGAGKNMFHATSH